MDTADRSWNRWVGVIVVSGLVMIGALALVIVPVVVGQGAGLSAFTAICRAIGIGAGKPSLAGPAPRAAPATYVAWTAPEFASLAQANKSAGANLAQATCVACHAANGSSPDPSIPGMAGQSAFAIYKELQDFKSGARVNEVMAPIAQPLELEQMADVAVYYASLSRHDLDDAHPSYAGAEIASLALRGDSARALPPCAACHAPGAGGPIETPSLTGQSAVYVTAQLQAFADGNRHNDVFERMRSIAAKLTRPEMTLLGAYYTTPH